MNRKIYAFRQLTTMIKSVLRVKRVYPTIFLFLVSTLDSWYTKIAIVPIANG